MEFLVEDLQRLVNNQWWRWIAIWFSGPPWVVFSYRLDRCLYLIFGSIYPVVRILFRPVFLFMRVLGEGHDIHYAAQIGKGLLVLHPSLGVVVSGLATCGDNLTLTGGNCIGIRKAVKPGDLILGSNVVLGVNAVVLGPVKIGDKCRIGAGAVVTRDAADASVLVGVPAVATPRRNQRRPIE